MARSHSRTLAGCLLAVVMLTLRPGGLRADGAAPPAVVLRPPDLWSFKVESRRLLADLGYHTEYAFEFYDEEEIRVRATAERAEIVEGTLRTILDGEPAYALIRLRGEEAPLWVVMNPGSRQAAWMTPDGLKGVDLPGAEVLRRVTLLTSFLRELRERLGLRNFRPSVASQVRVRIAQVDVLTLVPGTGSIVRYELRLPASGDAAETLINQVQDQTWTITWAAPTLTVRIAIPRRAPVTRTYQLRPGDGRDGTATAALTLLRGARERFGIGTVASPLP